MADNSERDNKKIEDLEEELERERFYRTRKFGRAVSGAPAAGIRSFGGIFRGIGGIIGWLLQLSLLVVFIMVLITAYTWGCFDWLPYGDSFEDSICGGFLLRGATAAENTPIGEVTIREGQSIWSAIFNPEEYFTRKYITPDTKTLEEPEYIVRIHRLQSGKPNAAYLDNEPIEVLAEVSITSPPDTPITAEFECVMDRSDTKGEIIGLPFNSNSIDVFEGRDEEYSLICSFPENIITTSKTVTKKVTFDALYNTVANSKLAVYTLEQNALKQLRALEDPIDYLRRINPNIDSDGVLPPESSPGPIKFGVSISGRQPLTDGTKYSLQVYIENRLAAQGHIDGIQFIEITLPDTFRLITSDSKCQFEPLPSDGNGLYENRYQLKPERLETINIDCNAAGSILDCINNYKNSAFFWCPIKIDKPARDRPEISAIEAKIDYTYKTKKSSTVKIVPSAVI